MHCHPQRLSPALGLPSELQTAWSPSAAGQGSVPMVVPLRGFHVGQPHKITIRTYSTISEVTIIQIRVKGHKWQLPAIMVGNAARFPRKYRSCFCAVKNIECIWHMRYRIQPNTFWSSLTPGLTFFWYLFLILENRKWLLRKCTDHILPNETSGAECTSWAWDKSGRTLTSGFVKSDVVTRIYTECTSTT